MSGWTPVPDKLVARLFKVARIHDKKSALELHLLSQTCRKAGWEGLIPGQIRITETQVSELLHTSRSFAHKILGELMEEHGLIRQSAGILAWIEPKADWLAENRAVKPLETLASIPKVRAEKIAEKGAVSIYHRDKTKTSAKPSIENILDNNGDSLVTVFWKLSAIFGKGKNLKARDAASAFLSAVQAGNDPESIMLAAEYTIQALSNQKYAPQLVTWLEQESYLAGSVQIIPAKEYKRVNDE